MNALVKKLSGVVVVVLFLAGPTVAEPEAFVRNVGVELAQAAQTAKQDTGAGLAAITSVLNQRFSVASLAASALPEAYRDKRDSAYVEAYRDYLARVFVRETLGSGTAQIEPIGNRPGSGLILVGANIKQDGSILRMVEFMLRPEGAGYRIVNMSVEGVLVTAQQQKDFMPHLLSGDMPGLIAFLTGGA
ncbi:ABC transporter substrate-binding protein [Maritimibacter dapengensis]|uniref:ABC transporter substrate-binding protein n=1 Tax=Maritimibacter dapengensis TaxID=2836868 RepID=A0ABS6SXF0_9RHOB|nr:ABC transporter substrate-binding protein [Maritimibacter dapengensis]MBV7377648.1 ABC transporter substrate-binding protein [Maritimibacter dapengensis]